MTNLKRFTISFLVTTAVLLALLYARRSTHTLTVPKVLDLGGRVSFTSQLKVEQIGFVRGFGFRTIVDFRPDGEAADQPPSSAIAAAATDAEMRFYYLPTPHEAIPDHVVDELRDALSQTEAPVLLYCRTGRRAVRVFALAEASRADGPAAGDILRMVRAAGFSADDLKDAIAERISRRNNAPSPQP